MRNVVIIVTLALAPCIAEAKLYKWVDAQGKVHYSDTMPDSQAASRGTSEMNKRAIVIKDAETPEQRAAKAAAEQKSKQEEQLRQEQARRDKALLDTFANTKEIDALRDRHLDQLNAVLSTNAARRKVAEARLAEYRKQSAHFAKLQRPAPKDLAQDINNTEREITQLNVDTANRQKERADIIQRAEDDKKRLIELRGR